MLTSNLLFPPRLYRIYEGKRYVHYADLMFTDQENQQLLNQAHKNFRLVRKVKHKRDGYYRLFVRDLRYSLIDPEKIKGLSFEYRIDLARN